jgi:hypothetical protein
MNLRLKKLLIDYPKKKINWVAYNNTQFLTGASNISIGINKPYNLSQYNEHNELINFFDYNYNIGIDNNIKLSTNFYIEQYEFKPIHNKIDRHYQMNIMNKMIFNEMQNSESLLENYVVNIPSYKFVYFYQIDGEIDFYYNFVYKKQYFPKENDILLFDKNTMSHHVYNEKYNKLQLNVGTIGIIVMNIQKTL